MADRRTHRERPIVRALLACVLLVALAGSFVLVGSLEPDPARNHYPEPEHLADAPERYVGDRVTVGGTVVDTDPVTVESDAGTDAVTFTVDGLEADPAVGDHLTVHGTLREPGHVTATAAVHRESWEIAYMYLVSIVGALWVLGRTLNRWTIDSAAWTVVPREGTLLEGIRDG